MDAEHPDVGAAVGFSASAGDARLAIDVRLDGAAVTHAHVAHVIAHSDHFDSQFMAEDARIAEKWLFAGECMDVRAAHTDAMDAHEGLTGLRRSGWLGLEQGEPSGFVESYDVHDFEIV